MSETTLQTLCRWAAVFNCWQWPEDFPTPKPDDFDELSRFRSSSNGKPTKADVLHPFVIALRTILPRKEISRYWNTVHDTTKTAMTDAQFEEWWASECNADVLASILQKVDVSDEPLIAEKK